MNPVDRVNHVLKMNPVLKTKTIPVEKDGANIYFYLHEQGHVKDPGGIYNYPGRVSENEMEKSR